MIEKPNRVTGEIIVEGRDVLKMSPAELRRYRWRQASMIFQASMNTLDPVITVGQSFRDLLINKDVASKDDAEEVARSTLELVGLKPGTLRMYPHELSGGMKQRVAIAMAVSSNPSLLIADEPTTALDTITQSSILRLMKSLREQGKIQSIVFVSHDISVHAYMTERLVIMLRGRIIEEGPTKDVIQAPMHPYTKLLMSSIKVGGEKERVEKQKQQQQMMVGESLPPEGACPYVPFCPYAMKVCSETFPKSVAEGPEHEVACFLYGGE
jgi:peptide/nickel transport system ATP-binding protein